MNEQNSPRGVLNFRLFGIPVSIHPMSWVILAVLGGAFGVSDGDDLSRVAVFVVAGMLCLLVHEFGHALTGRATGGAVVGIEVAGLGGSTQFLMLPQQRWAYVLVVLAGPLASLLLGGLLGLCFGGLLGCPWAGVRYAYLMPWMEVLPFDLQRDLLLGLNAHEVSPVVLQALTTGMLVCFWWSLFNLLPVFPLDGGKLLGSLLNNYLIPCVLGLLICGGLGIWALVDGEWFNVMILGYLGFINWQDLRVFRQRRGGE